MTKQRAIPVVDLSKFTNGTPQEREQFVKELGKAFHEVGVCRRRESWYS